LNIGVVGLIININVFGCICLVGGVVSLGGESRLFLIALKQPLY